ncbi:MAG: FIG003003: hypothetical protein, partial [uncultured Gemmatimonadetes bacterium]
PAYGEDGAQLGGAGGAPAGLPLHGQALPAVHPPAQERVDGGGGGRVARGDGPDPGGGADGGAPPPVPLVVPAHGREPGVAGRPGDHLQRLPAGAGGAARELEHGRLLRRAGGPRDRLREHRPAALRRLHRAERARHVAGGLRARARPQLPGLVPRQGRAARALRLPVPALRAGAVGRAHQGHRQAEGHRGRVRGHQQPLPRQGRNQRADAAVDGGEEEGARPLRHLPRIRRGAGALRRAARAGGSGGL